MFKIICVKIHFYLPMLYNKRTFHPTKKNSKNESRIMEKGKETKEAFLFARVTSSEKNNVEKMAKEKGLSLSEFVRHCIQSLELKRFASTLN